MCVCVCVCVRVCVHTVVPGRHPWRAARLCLRCACHVHFRARVGSGSPGTGALRGQGVFCLTHAFIYSCGFDAEKDRAFDVCMCVHVLCGYFTHTVCSLHECVFVCLHMHVCMHVYEV